MFTDIAPAREALFTQAREHGDQPNAEALDADALVETLKLARHGNPVDDTVAPGVGVTSATGVVRTTKHRCAPRAKMIVRVDFDTLLRGYPTDGEVCEIAGYGPVSVTAVRDMLSTGDAFLSAVVTRGEQVLGVAHLGRKALAHQQTALEWLNPTCAADGCAQTARLETDHRADWSKTRITMLDLLDRLCEHHHDLKTRRNWALVTGNGKRPFVPPDDPSHPEHGHPEHGHPRIRSRGDPSAA